MKKKINIFNLLGLNIKKNMFYLKNNHINYFLTRNLKLTKMIENKNKCFDFVNKIKTYKSYRNIHGYPARGQRTHTNAKTKKKTKIKNF